MGLFSKQKKNLDEEMRSYIELGEMKEAILDLKKIVNDQAHEILKLDGHIKSIRGSFNQFKFRNKEDPEESEDIKTSKPTDVLRGL